MVKRRGRRVRRGALAILAGLLVILAACSQGGNGQLSLAPRELPISGPVPDASGKLIYGNGRFLRALTPSTGAVAQLLDFPSGSAPDAPTVSPDGKLVAFSVYHEGKDSDDPASGIDLWVMHSGGGGQRPVLMHHGAGEWLVNGAWSPDGSSLYFTRRSPADAPRIERVRLDGSERKVIVEKGESPTISRDGRWLAYLSDDEQSGSQVLSVAPLEGGSPHSLLASLGFKALAGPRFAPDGTRLAFVAVGGPRSPAPSASQSCCRDLFCLCLHG